MTLSVAEAACCMILSICVGSAVTILVLVFGVFGGPTKKEIEEGEIKIRECQEKLLQAQKKYLAALDYGSLDPVRRSQKDVLS